MALYGKADRAIVSTPCTADRFYPQLFAEGVGIGPLSGVAFVAQIAEPRISPTVSGISAFFILNADQGGFASYPKTKTKSPDEED